jgi:glucan endo-1,3-alpha-glucosidase
MTSFPCNTAAQAQQYAQLVSSYKSHPNQAFYQNKLLLTLFDGAYCTFGQPTVDAGWAYFRSQMTALNTPVYIMPSIFVGLEQQNWFDGHFDWDNSWPMEAEDLDGSQDIAAKAQMTARRKGYMPGISPNFFTYYAPQSYVSSVLSILIVCGS